VNYDATSAGVEIISSSLNGYNDWANVRLDQVGAGRNENMFSAGNFATPGLGDTIDAGSSDMLDLGSGDFVDLGPAAFLDFGSGPYLDFGNGNFLDTSAPGTSPTAGELINLGSGDTVEVSGGDTVEVSGGDTIEVSGGDTIEVSGGQEIDYDRLRAFGRAAPYGLTGCTISSTGCLQVPKADPTYHQVLLNWTPPPFGHVTTYQIYRKKGTSSGNGGFQQIGTTSATTFIDLNSVSPNQQYTYYVRAVESDDQATNALTPRSNLFVITITFK
jgi:hypothetical protein